MIPLDELRDFLESKHDLYNRPEFIAADPVSIPHSYNRKEDIEISGLFAATLAWGRRDLIVRSARQLCARIGESPLDFVCSAGEDHLEALDNFVYRTFQATDARSFIQGLRHIYRHQGGLESLLGPRPGEPDTMAAILRFRNVMLSADGFLKRSSKHVADPSAGSSAKRLNMFLRWMVRNDDRGVDFGIWKNASPSQLICPLDVHTGNVGRKLGLLERKSDDWRAALELTVNLRRFDPADPVKYDFSLFGVGIMEGF